MRNPNNLDNKTNSKYFLFPSSHLHLHLIVPCRNFEISSQVERLRCVHPSEKSFLQGEQLRLWSSGIVDFDKFPASSILFVYFGKLEKGGDHVMDLSSFVQVGLLTRSGCERSLLQVAKKGRCHFQGLCALLSSDPLMATSPQCGACRSFWKC
jgi:hypothetical protein